MTLQVGKVLVGLLRCPRLSDEHAALLHRHTSDAIHVIAASGKFELPEYYALLKGGHCMISDEPPVNQVLQWRSAAIWNKPIDKKEVALLILVVDVTFTKLLDARILSFVTKGKPKVKEDWWRAAIKKRARHRATAVSVRTSAGSLCDPVEYEQVKPCTWYLSQDPVITEFAEEIFQAAASLTPRPTWDSRTSTSIL